MRSVLPSKLIQNTWRASELNLAGTSLRDTDQSVRPDSIDSATSTKSWETEESDDLGEEKDEQAKKHDSG